MDVWLRVMKERNRSGRLLHLTVTTPTSSVTGKTFSGERSAHSGAWMADGAPLPVGGADLHSNTDGLLAGGILQAPPTDGLSPCTLVALIKVVQYGVGIALSIHQPVDPRREQRRNYGARRHQWARRQHHE
jgi:hypothetical protein